MEREKKKDVSIVNIKMRTGTKTCFKRKQRETRAGFYSDRQINNNGNHYWPTDDDKRTQKIILTRSKIKRVKVETLEFNF